MRRMLLWALLLASSALLAQTGGELRFCIRSEPKTFNPLLVEDISAMASRERWDVKELYAEAGRLDDVFRAITTHDAARARESRA